MSIALSTAVLDLIQQDILRKDVEVALRPKQMFRTLVSKREKWNARNGQQEYITRNGLLNINTKPRVAGVDPVPQAKNGIEQFGITCNPYNDSTTTNLPNDYIEIQSEFLKDARALMIQAGVTLSHIVRNKIYNTYLGGNTVVDVTSSGTSVHVVNLAGFYQTLSAAQPRLANVSNTNPIGCTIGGVAASIVSVLADDLTQPDGPGVLTLASALAVTAGNAVVATKAPLVYRVGGASSSDGIVTGNKITYADIVSVVASLRSSNVEPMPDGTFHVHLDPQSEAQLLGDSALRQILTSLPHSPEWQHAAIGVAAGVTFFRNNETPNQYNTTADDYIAAKMVNNSGVPIRRPVVYGQGAIIEKYVPLDAMYAMAMGNAPMGVASISDFNISQDQTTADLVMDGIKYIVRAPQDKLQENLDQTWSFKGDWACPCDSLTGTPALYKRAVVIEHAA